MGNFLGQPWYVDIFVLLLPVAVAAVAYQLMHGRRCFECGHKATRLLDKRYCCDACFRKKYGEPVVLFQRVTVDKEQAQPLPPAAIRPGTNGKKAKSSRRRMAKKAK